MINDDSNNGNNGLKGRFRERLRLIRISRHKKGTKEKIKEENKKFIEDRLKKIDEILSKDNKSNYSNDRIVIVKKFIKKKRISKDREIDAKVSVKKKATTDYRRRKEVDNNKSSEDNQNKFIYNVIKKIRSTASDRNYKYGYGVYKKDNSNNGIDIKEINAIKDELKIKIIKRIKNDFDKKIAELDVLESELYFLNKDNDRELELDKVKKIKKKIEDILNKINNIIEQYNIYRNNYELEDIINLEDGTLVDDIIDFKYIVDNYNFNRELVNDYKLLSEYQELYNKLDEIKVISNRVILENQDKIKNLYIRDKKYDDIEKGCAKVYKVLEKCDYEIEKQNDYFKKLMAKVDKIDSREYVDYKFIGLSKLISESLKYIGLLMVSPFSGLLPSIAIETLATRRMIKNIYKNMHIDEIKKVEYMALDYDNEIRDKLNDIDYTYYLIDDTIKLVEDLKSDFISQYNYDIPGYSDTLHKINNISDKLKQNRVKVDVVKDNLIVSKKINADKMVKVKKLNKSSM